MFHMPQAYRVATEEDRSKAHNSLSVAGGIRLSQAIVNPPMVDQYLAEARSAWKNNVLGSGKKPGTLQAGNYGRHKFPRKDFTGDTGCTTSSIAGL